VSTPTQAGATVVIKATGANTGSIFVGYANTVTANTNAATDGFELTAGQSDPIPAFKFAADLANIWLIASAASQAVCYEVR
jgi:hypothetical protein